MKQLTLDFEFPPESVITPAIPFTADHMRELVTHMVTAIIAVYHAGGALTDEHASASSQNHTPAPAAQSDWGVALLQRRLKPWLLSLLSSPVLFRILLQRRF